MHRSAPVDTSNPRLPSAHLELVVFNTHAELSAASCPPDGAASPQLSPRMLSCLQWASEGKSSVDIGQLLGISPRTVDDYLTECRRRLGVRTRVQAIVRALALGHIRA